MLLLPLILLSLAVLATGWLVYQNKETTKQSRAYTVKHLRQGPYVYRPVKIDVSHNKLTLFNGFSFNYPNNWVGNKDDKFSSQITNGQIGNLQYTNKISAYLYSYNYTEWATSRQQLEKQVETINPNEEPKQGASIAITVFVDKEPRQQTTDCSAYEKSHSTGAVTTLKFNDHTVCEVRVADRQYDYYTNTSKASYFTELLISKQALPEQRDYFISAARAIEKSFQLY